MLRDSKFLICILFLGALLLPVPGNATTVLEREVGELVDEAPLIFVGTASDIHVKVLAKESYPMTLVTFEVEELFKGSAEENRLTLAFEGGEVGDEIFEVIGMPTFELGGRYLLFVGHNGARGGSPTVGWWQGKLDFVRHPLSGAEILVDHRGTPLVGLEGDAWKRAPIFLDGTGFARNATPAGVELVEEDGVAISGLSQLHKTADEALAEVPGAEAVLGVFRSFANRRASLGSYRSASLIPSVTAADLAAAGKGLPVGTSFDPQPTAIQPSQR